MKCVACNYEHEIDYCNSKNSKGDEEFIEITNTLITDKKRDSYGFGHINKTGKLYICPKCQTVRFEFDY